jgi:NodT family efflux transporter outer membrane factor (OMF) lipoprotein
MPTSSNGPRLIVSQESVDLADWWTVLGDKTLDSLLSQAIQKNLDVRAAIERVNQARALRGVARSQLLPTVDAVGSYERSRISPNSPIGQQIPKHTSDDWQAGFDANWELDLFGRIRRGVEAANADLEALEDARRDVLVRLLAETARNYVELRAAQRRLAIANDTLKSQRDTLELVRARRAAGAVGDLDVSRAAADVRTTEATIPSLQGDIDEAIFSIGVLLGQEPEVLYDQLVVAQPIPIPATAVPVGLPSDLLRRRPDIRQAERALAAATARIGVATADFYPRVSLTGSFVMDATKFSKLGNWDSRQFGIGPTLAWNVFDAGRIANNVRFTEARQREALVQYQHVVLDSLKETETAISRYTKEFARRQSLEQAVRENERSVSLAKDQYQAGSIDLLQVLDTQRNLFASQDQLARSDQTISTELIVLYKSLGGGWQGHEPDAKPPSAARPAGCSRPSCGRSCPPPTS